MIFFFFFWSLANQAHWKNRNRNCVQWGLPVLKFLLSSPSSPLPSPPLLPLPSPISLPINSFPNSEILQVPGVGSVTLSSFCRIACFSYKLWVDPALFSSLSFSHAHRILIWPCQGRSDSLPPPPEGHPRVFPELGILRNEGAGRKKWNRRVLFPGMCAAWPNCLVI